MKISVIIPIYNNATHINQLVIALQAQTFTKFEALFIDDASTDNSVATLTAAIGDDARMRVFTNQHHGQSWQRHFGVQQAQYDLISFVDGDDWVQPAFLAHLYTAMRDNDADLVTASYQVQTPTGKLQATDKLTTNAILDQTAYKQALMTDDIQGFCWNKLYRKRLLQQVMIPDENNFFEDTRLNAALVPLLHKIVTIDATDYVYVQNANSVLHQVPTHSDFVGLTATLQAFSALVHSPKDAQLYKYRYLLILTLIIQRTPWRELSNPALSAAVSDFATDQTSLRGVTSKVKWLFAQLLAQHQIKLAKLLLIILFKIRK
ncbi:MAG: glycosyltransferase [Lactobacillaceae bacterium]|jgi:glycosyltransferase involved in cell wall biosynthesis|nr:glycosyltransferase [Lactobacillaceae bacterium]